MGRVARPGGSAGLGRVGIGEVGAEVGATALLARGGCPHGEAGDVEQIGGLGVGGAGEGLERARRDGEALGVALQPAAGPHDASHRGAHGVCVCRAQSLAYDDVSSLLDQIVRKRPFRYGKLVIARNEVGGPFHPQFERDLVAAFPEAQLTFLTIPACQAEIWPAIERVGVSLDEILDKNEEELMAVLDVDLWTAASGMAEIRAWVDHCVRIIRESNLV